MNSPFHVNAISLNLLFGLEAAWYWLEVSQEESDAGVLVHCLSTSSSKYKVILFDRDGATRQFEDSEKKKYGTEVDMYFVQWDRYSFDFRNPRHISAVLKNIFYVQSEEI